jgi:hypothetical protein
MYRHALGQWLTICTVILAVCHVAAADEQRTDAKANDAAVDEETVDSGELSKALLKIEQALQRIQRRAAGDGTLKRLTDATIQQYRYPNGKGGYKGGRISISAPTDDQIEIPTNRAAVKVPGEIVVRIDYVRQESESTHCGLFNGCVTWKTNNANVFVTLGWFTRDSTAPDRLLTILSVELQREGIRLVPHKLYWPIATPAERLSQVLPPSVLPPATSPPAGAEGSPAAPRRTKRVAGEKVFASPQDVVTAYRQAYAKKDWAACVLCLTPAARGEVVREFLFVAGMGNSPKLAKALDKSLKLKLSDDTGTESKEAREFFEPLAKLPTGDEEADNVLLYETFQKRIGDVPAFLAELCQQAPILAECEEIDGIRSEGDKASGYFTIKHPPPDPTDVGEKIAPTYCLPQYNPCHFRKLGGSWLLADAFLHQ